MIEDEFWVAEVNAEQTKYFGPFPTEQAAHDWGNAVRAPGCIIVHVLPLAAWEEA